MSMFMKTVVAIAVPFTLGWIGIVLWFGAKALGIFDVMVLTPFGEQVVDAWPWMTAALAVMLVICGAGIAHNERT